MKLNSLLKLFKSGSDIVYKDIDRFASINKQ